MSYLLLCVSVLICTGTLMSLEPFIQYGGKMSHQHVIRCHRRRLQPSHPLCRDLYTGHNLYPHISPVPTDQKTLELESKPKNAIPIYEETTNLVRKLEVILRNLELPLWPLTTDMTCTTGTSASFGRGRMDSRIRAVDDSSLALR
jgi:hypothetical protein